MARLLFIAPPARKFRMKPPDSRSDASLSPAIDPGAANIGAATTPVRLLGVCTVDVMAWKLLRPWFRALADAGYEVHLACSKGDWFQHLAADGFHMHEVPLRRRVNPFVHIAPLWELFWPATRNISRYD